jgi:oxaloacetate decarboxylase gamma subunit
MTIFQMLEQSAVLSVLGMGIVFSFLVIMVICVTIMGKIFHGIDKGTGEKASPQSGGDAKTIAAITAAVNEYRSNT